MGGREGVAAAVRVAVGVGVAVRGDGSGALEAVVVGAVVVGAGPALPLTGPHPTSASALTARAARAAIGLDRVPGVTAVTP